MSSQREYDAWEPVPNSNGMLKRFEVGTRGWVYAAFEWVPPLLGEAGVIQQEHWRMVNAFFVERKMH